MPSTLPVKDKLLLVVGKLLHAGRHERRAPDRAGGDGGGCRGGGGLGRGGLAGGAGKGGLGLAGAGDGLGLLLLLGVGLWGLLGLVHDRKEGGAHVVPRPHGLEALDDRHVLPQVGKQPETGLQDKVGDAEQDDAEDGHGEEETEEQQERPAEVVDALAHLEGPQRVQHDDEDEQQEEPRVDLAHDLTALPQPGVVHVVLGVLLLLDAHRPLALDALALLGRRVVVALVLVRLGDAQGEHRHGQQLERVFERGAVRDLGQGGVLLAGLFVGGRLEGAEGALDWAGSAGAMVHEDEELTLEHVLALAIEDAGARLEVLAAEKGGQGEGEGIRGPGDDGLWLALLVLVLVLVFGLLRLLHLLLLHVLLLHPHLLLHGLLAELVDELGHRHAGLFGVDGELALHGRDLLGGGHLPGLWWALHGGRCVMGCPGVECRVSSAGER